MKRKLTISLVIATLVTASIFFIYFIAKNEMSKSGSSTEQFIPEDIDISSIEDDEEFARTIPDYEILFTGLVRDEAITDFAGILENIKCSAE